MISYEIIWSPNATLTYYQILQYLDKNWTSKEVNGIIAEILRVYNCNVLPFD